MVQLLVAEGAGMEALDGAGLTPLMLASGMGDHAVAQALLAAGADATLRWDGHTALDVAARDGHVLVLAVLIRHGVDPNDAGICRTALHCAASWNRPEAIDILVAGGADSEVRDNQGYAPLHDASSELSFEAAVALLKHGADINARGGRLGHTPLHKAARQAGKRGAVEMVDLLLRWGADEAVADRFGRRTPDDVAGIDCHGVDEVGGVERIRKLLANAPA